jgi:hypothetical protein
MNRLNKIRIDEFLKNSIGFLFIIVFLEILSFIYYVKFKSNYEIPFLLPHFIFFVSIALSVLNSVFFLCIDKFFIKKSDMDYLSFLPTFIITFFIIIYYGYIPHSYSLNVFAILISFFIINYFRFKRIRNYRNSNII